MAKFAAKGAIVKTGSSATPTTNLTQVKSVSMTVGEREPIPATTHDSTTTKDFVMPSIRETNSLDIEIVYDPGDATHEAVRAAQSAGTLWYFTLVLPDTGNAQWAMSGYVLTFALGSMDPETGLLTASIRFKANTVDTFTA